MECVPAGEGRRLQPAPLSNPRIPQSPRAGVTPMRAWLARVDQWRERTGGVELALPRVALEPQGVDFELSNL